MQIVKNVPKNPSLVSHYPFWMKTKTKHKKIMKREDDEKEGPLITLCACAMFGNVCHEGFHLVEDAVAHVPLAFHDDLLHVFLEGGLLLLLMRRTLFLGQRRLVLLRDGSVHYKIKHFLFGIAYVIQFNIEFCFTPFGIYS